MNEHRTLISVDHLQALIAARASLVLLDCRFDLGDPAAGERDYRAGHLPGAHYLHLDRDLSAERLDAEGRMRGRHPLPAPEHFAALMRALGVGPGVQVVAYDAQPGVYAARAWWMLKWIGHEATAVLDGGMAAWVQAGGEISTDMPSRPAIAGEPLAVTPRRPTVDADTLMRDLGRVKLLDARAPERFRGEVEPIDPVAGHIPGALNRPFQANLAPDGRFKPADQLAQDYRALLAGAIPEAVIHQCGSGVTACHNLLAMEHAGLTGSQLYPGSWSEWCADPRRPVARGDALG